METINTFSQEKIIRERLGRYADLARTVKHDDSLRQGYLKFKIEKVIPRALRALHRIEKGTYCICEDCGEEIGNRRLLAVPAATKCLSCQKASEKNLL